MPMSSHLVSTLTNIPHLLKLDILVGEIIDLNLFGLRSRSYPVHHLRLQPIAKEFTLDIYASLFFPFSNSAEIHFHLHWIIPFKMRTTTSKAFPNLYLILWKRGLSLSSFPTFIFLFSNLDFPIFLLPIPLVFLFEVRRTPWVVTIIEVPTCLLPLWQN